MDVLVTGATGYIGGRLVPRLLAGGHRVRVLSRDPRRLAGLPWEPEVRAFRGDAADGAAVERALDGADAAYYLVHSMCTGDDFRELDRRAADAFGRAAAACGVRRVVYLGGLQPSTPERGAPPSEHLASRAEVGEVLAASVPTAEVRAGPIIGSGSASFEMVRYLTERLPAMVAPRWILNPVRPVAVADVLAYLEAVLDHPDAEGVLEVGAEPLTFKAMMDVYAGVRGLRRVIVPVPVLAPRLAARWVGLVTPIPNCLAVPLVEGVVHPVVGDVSRAESLFPDLRPVSYREAVERAVDRTRSGEVVTRWSGAVGGASTYELEDREGVVRETRTRFVDAPPEAVYRSFASLGGERGWLVWEWAWRLRGLADKLGGGPGLRRGRRHPEELRPGEAVDFWRVEAADPPRLLRLRAEMKVPGRAWLQWETRPEDGGTRLVQTAFFFPDGVVGTLYWYGLYPVHRFIFSDLVDAVARDARAGGRGPDAASAPPAARRGGTRAATHGSGDGR